MKYITQKYWHRFMENNDGRLFESLCLRLLQFLYPYDEWHQTSRSWDGKKDFFADLNIGELCQIKCWAECKCHMENLSIDAISSTLVVGTLENAGIIIFFSYSSLNENAEDYLAFFQEKTGKKIIIYDDIKLEQLIIQYYKQSEHPEIMTDFFPEFLFETLESNIFSEYPIHFHYFLSNPYTHNVFKKYSKDFYRVNDVFIVNYFFENTSINEKVIIDFTIEYDRVKHKYLQFLNLDTCSKMNPLILHPGEIKYLQCKYKILSYQKSIILPRLIYQLKGKLFYPSVKPLKGKWLADTTLIGGNYISIVDLHQELLSIQNRDNYFFSTLCGESGTGKSRLLKEICDNAIGQGYEVFRYNGEYQLSDNEEWLKAYLSIAYALPYQKTTYHIVTDTINIDRNDAISILYDEHFDFSKEYNKAKQLIIKHLIKNKHLLVFDNIQFFSDDTIKLINDLITFATNNDCQFKIILSINSDYLFPKTEAKKLYDRLLWKKKEDKEHFFINYIEGFTKEQARIYISSCLNCENVNENSQYINTINLLISKTGILPVSIEQTLFYLVQKDVLKRENDYFIINNLDDFHQKLQTIPCELKQILNKRLKIIEEQLDDASKIFEYLSLLTFMQEVDYEFLHLYGADFSLIEIMIDLGLVRCTDDDTYIIYHNILKRYFKSHFKKNIFEIQSSIAELLEKNGMEGVYPIQYVISKSHMTYSPELLNYSVQILLTNHKQHDLQEEFDTVSKKLFFYASNDSNISREHMRAATILCYHYQIYNTYEICIKKYNDFKRNYFMKYKVCFSYGEELVDFIRQFINVYILLRQEKEGNNLIDEIFNQWNELSFQNEYSKKKMYGLLLTRKCVVFKSLNMIQEAEDVAENVISLSEQLQDDELYIRICFDYGYIYYTTYKERDKVKLHWDNAYKRYQSSHEASLFKMQGSVYFHEALVKTIFFEYEDARKFAEKAIKFFELNEKTPYYKTKLYLLMAIIYFIRFMEGKTELLELVKENLDKAEDLSIAFHSNRLYYKCLYLRGKVFFAQKCYSACDIYLEQALTEIYSNIYDVNEEERYFPIIYDIYYMKRFYQKKCIIYTEIKNTMLKKEIQKLFEMDTDSWNAFRDHFKAYSIITSKSRDTNYPKP